MLSRADAAAEVMEHLINHAAHGYSQDNREGDGTREAVRLSDGEVVWVAGGDRDCASAVCECYEAVGVIPEGTYMWTGNERAILKAAGFVQVNLSHLRRGDVLWKQGHTEMYLGNGLQGGARIDEAGGIHGHTKGDQTGNEIGRSAFDQDYWHWQSAWRYFGAERELLEVDGWLGALSVTEWQRQLGTPADGMVSGQPLELAEWWPRLASVEFGTGGSSLVRAIQRKVSAPVDGYLGPKTVKALQLWLARAGYFVGEVDGILGANTAKAVQRSLNDRAWS